MDFLKKHYEKVTLALVSLLLIGTAVILMGKLVLSGVEAPGDDKENYSPAKPVDTNELARVASLLQQPQRWDGKGPAPFIPGRWKFDPCTGGMTEVGKDVVVVTKTNVLFELDFHVRFKTFPMEFKGIVTGEGTNATFQINIADDRSSRFVKVGMAWRQVISGYWETFGAIKFEQKKVERLNPSTRHRETVDLSILTLRRRGGVEIPLEMGKRRLESDPVASYVATRGTGERSGEMVKGSVFRYKGKKFKLLDITIRLLLVEESESGAVHEISPRGVSGQ